jgi:hypothetical protein
MKNELLVFSFVLCAAPGLAMFFLGPSSLVQTLGIVIVIVAALMLPFGVLTKGGIAKFGWIVLVLVLFVLALASGYIAIAGGFSLGFNTSLIELVSLTVLLVEMGIFFSMMYGNYLVYFTELKKAGYDEAEFHSELHSFDRFLILLTLASAGISIGIYFLFSILPSVGIDALTGLIISAIIYFVIARYVMSQRKATPRTPVAS